MKIVIVNLTKTPRRERKSKMKKVIIATIIIVLLSLLFSLAGRDRRPDPSLYFIPMIPRAEQGE